MKSRQRKVENCRGTELILQVGPGVRNGAAEDTGFGRLSGSWNRPRGVRHRPRAADDRPRQLSGGYYMGRTEWGPAPSSGNRRPTITAETSGASKHATG